MNQREKRNRPIEEKIEDALDKVGNIHPDTRNELVAELISGKTDAKLTSVASMQQWITKRLNTPEQGIQCKAYWIARGWSEPQARFNSKEAGKKYPRKKSPFSIEFWTDKINPDTGINYTNEEADYERNKRISIKKEYWLSKGYSEEIAKIKAEETKRNNSKKGGQKFKSLGADVHKTNTRRCKEYWMIRGFSEEDALEKVSAAQSTFSLKKCIEKYGEEIGKQKWQDRQDKWQNSLRNGRSDEEWNELSKRKSSKVNYKSLWNNELDMDANFYIIQINETTFKIGITTKNTIHKRYKKHDISNFNILKFEISCFLYLL